MWKYGGCAKSISYFHRPISPTVFMLSIAINRAEHVCATVIIKHIRPISRVVIGREVDYRSRLIYVRYCLTNTTLCLWRSYDCTLACNYV